MARRTFLVNIDIDVYDDDITAADIERDLLKYIDSNDYMFYPDMVVTEDK